MSTQDGPSGGVSHGDPWARFQSGGSPSGSRRPPSSSGSSENDELTVWLRGFPRKLVVPQFKRHCEEKVLPLMHESIKHAVKPIYHNMSFSYMVIFPNKQTAQQFKDELSVRSMNCDWTDPRGNSARQIRAGVHKPLEIRKRGY
eukprot:5465500-Pyramimonas_sp.AAC.1